MSTTPPIMHNTLCISHYASFGKHSKLSNFWVASDSLWLEPLLTMQGQHSHDHPILQWDELFMNGKFPIKHFCKSLKFGGKCYI